MRDQKTEHYLNDGGYAFKYQAEFDLGLIDVEGAKTNPWRLHRRLDEYRVDAIGCAILEGADIPAIVLFDDADGYRLVTGLHRTMGAREAKTGALDAYLIVETDPYRRSLLARGINTIEGAAPSEQENLDQIVDLLREFPDRTVVDVARAFNMKPGTIERHVRIARVEKRGHDLGVGALFANGSMSRRIKELLGAIKSDPIFTRTAMIIGDTKARGTIAEVLIRDVQRSRSDQAAVKVLDAYEQEFTEREEAAKVKFGRVRSSIPTKAIYAVGRVVKFDNHPAWGGLEPSELTRGIAFCEEAEAKIKRWKREMIEIRKQHEKREGWRSSAAKRIGDSGSASISPSM
jgi:hypothetical protein